MLLSVIIHTINSICCDFTFTDLLLLSASTSWVMSVLRHSSLSLRRMARRAGKVVRRTYTTVSAPLMQVAEVGTQEYNIALYL